MRKPVHIRITASGNMPDWQRAAQSLPDSLVRNLRGGMHKANQLVIAKTVRNRFLGNGPFPASENRLGHRSRLLGRSIRSTRPQVNNGEITSSMGSHVKYFGIHEFGGRTKAHVIRAKNGKALAFNIGGKTILVKSVNHPGSKMPARAPLATGIEESDHIYQKQFDADVEKTLAEITD